MANDTRTLKVVVTGDSTSAKRALRDVGGEAHATESRLGHLASTMATFAARGTVALGAAATAAGVMGVKTASGTEQARIGFTNMLGSADAADQMLRRLTKFAESTPFELPGLIDSAQSLMAMGFSAEQVIPTLTAAGDAAAGLGKGAESVSAITRALGQMQVKGKVSGEELMQLHEQGVPALKILADSFGLSVTEMSKMVEKGGVLSSKALPLIVKGMEQGTKSTKGFGGMMAQQSTTVQGRWSTMLDTIRNGLGDLALKAFPLLNMAMLAVTDGADAFFKSLESGKASGTGFVGWASQAGVKVQEFAGWLRTDGVVWAQRFWGVLQTGVGIGQGVVNFLARHKNLLIALAAVYVTLTAAAKIHAAVMVVQKLLFMAHNGQLGIMLAKITLVRGAVAIWTAAQWLLNAALTANPIGLVIVAIAALVAGIVIAYKRSETFREIVNRLASQFVQGFGQMRDAAIWLWEKAIRPSLAFITKAWTTTVGAILQGAVKAFGWIPGIGPKLKTVVKEFDKFAGAVNKSFDKLKDRKLTVSATYSVRAGGASITAANFGKRHGLNKGGPIPKSWGVPGKDSVPALLMPDEFVVRADGSNLKEAIQHYGGLRMARGGVVPRVVLPSGEGIAGANAWAWDRAGTRVLRQTLNDILAAQTRLGTGAGGSALARVRAAMPAGTYVTSTYRSPAQNAAVGGSPTSYHMDRNNPAVDVGGPTRLLDLLYARLRAMGGWRELLWRTAGHWDHVHAAHAGGMVGDDWPRMPGWGYNERPARLQVGETVLPRGAGDITVHVHVAGNVVTERDLVKAITKDARDELLRLARRNGGRTGLPGK